MSNAFVLDAKKRPVNPVHPGYARRLLKEGRAAVYKRYPFTIILKHVVHADVKPLRLKIDPGSKTTGLAIVDDVSGEVVWAAELTHRGDAVKKGFESRRACRRSRRQRHTRYRKPRFNNRKRKAGWLPPSLKSRVDNIIVWVRKLLHFCPITAISQELVRFDTQLMQNSDISGIEYQQGTLQGCEMREYLLEKWDRKCAYCGAADVQLEIEHILCKARGGTNRENNLTISCKPCNRAKDKMLIEDFLKDKPDILKSILAQAKIPLKHAAVVNTTRLELYQRLRVFALPVETGTGGRTKYNRISRALPKAHWLDAACVGKSTSETLQIKEIYPLLIQANGRGSRQMCLMNNYGFPRTNPKKAKLVKGFQTGDIVRAVVTKGKKIGTYVGKVAIRSTGSFNITTKKETVQGIRYDFCKLVHRMDGYSYSKGETVCPPHD